MYMLLCWGEKPIFNTVILIVIILVAAEGITIVSRLYMLCGMKREETFNTNIEDNNSLTFTRNAGNTEYQTLFFTAVVEKLWTNPSSVSI